MIDNRLAAIQAKRAERQAELDKQRDEQLATDLEAVDALEIQHGDSNVAAITLPFTPGLPVMAAVRAPHPVEIKRYRDQVRTKPNGKPGDPVAAAEMLAAVCRIYPSDEAYAALCEARPGLHAQLGATAVALAVGKADDEGKG